MSASANGEPLMAEPPLAEPQKAEIQLRVNGEPRSCGAGLSLDLASLADRQALI